MEAAAEDGVGRGGRRWSGMGVEEAAWSGRRGSAVKVMERSAVGGGVMEWGWGVMEVAVAVVDGGGVE